MVDVMALRSKRMIVPGADPSFRRGRAALSLVVMKGDAS